jgi:hypothetical protein
VIHQLRIAFVEKESHDAVSPDDIERMGFIEIIA